MTPPIQYTKRLNKAYPELELVLEVGIDIVGANYVKNSSCKQAKANLVQ